MKDTKKEDDNDNKQWRTVIHKFFAGMKERDRQTEREKPKRNEGDGCVYVFVF